MTRFAKLAVTTVVATFVLVGLGGLVRAMEAGLGCPDWPTCYGSPNPPSTLAAGPLKLAWIEHSHRIWAAVLILLVCLLAIAARRTRQPRPLRVAAYLLVPAVLSQAVLGAIVVWAKLDAESVALHLGGALTVLGLASYVALRAVGHGPETLAVGPGPRGLAPAVAAVTFGQMLLGSTVTGYSAGLAYATFPSFNGRAVPPVVRTTQQWLHVSHRVTAYVLVVLVVLLWRATRRSADPVVRRGGGVALALVGVQVALGAVNIWSRLSGWSVVPHLVVGASLWVCLLVVALRVQWGSAPAVARARAHSPCPLAAT